MGIMALDSELPALGNMNIKAWWVANDYDRVHNLFLGKVDARGAMVQNLTISGVAGDGAQTYEWKDVDPSDYTNQIQPLLTITHDQLGPMYKSLLEHLIDRNYMAPPSTTAAEDVERKMLKAENQFLKELVTELAGTRKKESWHTSSIMNLSNMELEERMWELQQEVGRRTNWTMNQQSSLTGTQTTTGATGQSGQGVPNSHSGSSGHFAPVGIPGHKGIHGGTIEQPDYSASGQGHSKDRSGS